MSTMETSEQNGSPLPRLEAKGKGTAGNDLESKDENVCPECGGRLTFGSRDPCEGDYYWCGSCGYGPIRFPFHHVMSTESIAPTVERRSPGPGGAKGCPHRVPLRPYRLDRAAEPDTPDRLRNTRRTTHGVHQSRRPPTADPDRFTSPVPVMRIRQGIDGTEITEKIGYACRTVSGRALKISTSTSGGSWSCPG